MNDLTAQDYAKVLLGAAETIAAAQAKPTFDKTVIGEIIQTYEKRPNIYRVKVDNIAFDAKAQYDYKYHISDQVYITIVQGDYNGEKRIVGKLNEEDESEFFKTNPLKDMVIKKTAEFAKGVTFTGNGPSRNCSFGFSYSTANAKYIGVEFGLKVRQKIVSYDTTIWLQCQLKHGGTNVGDPFFIHGAELPGNIYRAHPNFHFTIVKDLKTIFDETGYAQEIDSIEIALISDKPFGAEDVFEGTLYKIYLGGSYNDLPTYILDTKIALEPNKEESPAPEEGEGEEVEEVNIVWNDTSVSALLGNEKLAEDSIILNRATQNILLSFTWQYLNPITKQYVIFNKEAFKDGAKPFNEFPELGANATITWERRSKASGEWLEFSGPYTVTSEYAYEIKDKYVIDTEPLYDSEDSETRKHIGYQHTENSDGDMVEYRAILSINNSISDIVYFENLFEPEVVSGDTSVTPEVEVDKEEIKEIIEDVLIGQTNIDISTNQTIEKINQEIIDVNAAVDAAEKTVEELQATSQQMREDLTEDSNQLNSLKKDLKPLSTYPTAQIEAWPTKDGVAVDIKRIYYKGNNVYRYYQNSSWHDSAFTSIPTLDTDLIYQVNTSTESGYWHYKNGEWSFTTDPDEAGIVSYTGFVSQANEHSAILASLVGYNSADGANSMAGTIQKAGQYGAQVSALAEYEYNGQKSLAGLKAYTNKDQAAIQSVATYASNNAVTTAGVSAHTNALEARTSLLAEYIGANLIIIDQVPDENLRDETCYYYGIPENTNPTNPLTQPFIWYFYLDGGWKNETVVFTDSIIAGRTAPRNENIVYSLSGFSNYLYRKGSIKNVGTEVKDIKRIELTQNDQGALVVTQPNETTYYSTPEYTYNGYNWFWGSAADAGIVTSIAGVQAFADAQGAKVSALASYTSEQAEAIAGLDAQVNGEGAVTSTIASLKNQDGSEGAAALINRVTEAESHASLSAQRLNNEVIILTQTQKDSPDGTNDKEKIYYAYASEGTYIWKYINGQWKKASVTFNGTVVSVSAENTILTTQDFFPKFKEITFDNAFIGYNENGEPQYDTITENVPCIYWIGKPISKYLYYNGDGDFTATTNPSEAGLYGGYAGFVVDVSDSGSSASMMVESIGKDGVVNAASIAASVVGDSTAIDMIANNITLNANQIKFTASNDLGINVVQNSDTKHDLTTTYDQIRYTLDTNYPLKEDIYTLSLSVNANKSTEFTVLTEGFSILGDVLDLKTSASGRQIIIGQFTVSSITSTTQAITIALNTSTSTTATIYGIQIEQGMYSTAWQNKVDNKFVSPTMNWQMLPDKCVWWNQSGSETNYLMKLDSNGLDLQGSLTVTGTLKAGKISSGNYAVNFSANASEYMYIAGWGIDFNSFYYGATDTTVSNAKAFICPTGWNGSNKVTIAGFQPYSGITNYKKYWSLKIGDNFGVSTSGNLHCSSFNLGFVSDDAEGYYREAILTTTDFIFSRNKSYFKLQEVSGRPIDLQVDIFASAIGYDLPESGIPWWPDYARLWIGSTADGSSYGELSGEWYYSYVDDNQGLQTISLQPMFKELAPLQPISAELASTFKDTQILLSRGDLEDYTSIILNSDTISLYLRASGPVAGAPSIFQGLTIGLSGGVLEGTWKLQSGVAITSDLYKKNSIMDLSSNYEILFDNLHPIKYKYNDGTSDRYHTGFIAQEVEQALIIANLSTQDFAAYVLDTSTDVRSLRYSEFIALNTHEIQKLKKRVAELEAQLNI